jgi:hypothetical protein
MQIESPGAAYSFEQELRQKGLTRFAPIVQMTMERYAALVMVPMHTSVPVAARRFAEPTLLALMDRGEAAGPDCWPQAQTLIEWATVIVMQDGAGSSQDYTWIKRPLSVHGRIVLIETTTKGRQQWEALLRQLHRERDVLAEPAPVQA